MVVGRCNGQRPNAYINGKKRFLFSSDNDSRYWVQLQQKSSRGSSMDYVPCDAFLLVCDQSLPLHGRHTPCLSDLTTLRCSCPLSVFSKPPFTPYVAHPMHASVCISSSEALTTLTSSLQILIEINSLDQLVIKTYPRLRRNNRWLLYFNE